jgi:hypothetical protein
VDLEGARAVVRAENLGEDDRFRSGFCRFAPVSVVAPTGDGRDPRALHSALRQLSNPERLRIQASVPVVSAQSSTTSTRFTESPF